ncbi:hypothetical protein V2J09_011713 [Rumex salicifolius]
MNCKSSSASLLKVDYEKVPKEEEVTEAHLQPHFGECLNATSVETLSSIFEFQMRVFIVREKRPESLFVKELKKQGETQLHCLRRTIEAHLLKRVKGKKEPKYFKRDVVCNKIYRRAKKKTTVKRKQEKVSKQQRT